MNDERDLVPQNQMNIVLETPLLMFIYLLSHGCAEEPVRNADEKRNKAEKEEEEKRRHFECST